MRHLKNKIVHAFPVISFNICIKEGESQLLEADYHTAWSRQQARRHGGTLMGRAPPGLSCIHQKGTSNINQCTSFADQYTCALSSSEFMGFEYYR